MKTTLGTKLYAVFEPETGENTVYIVEEIRGTLPLCLSPREITKLRIFLDKVEVQLRLLEKCPMRVRRGKIRNPVKALKEEIEE